MPASASHSKASSLVFGHGTIDCESPTAPSSGGGMAVTVFPTTNLPLRQRTSTPNLHSRPTCNSNLDRQIRCF